MSYLQCFEKRSWCRSNPRRCILKTAPVNRYYKMSASNKFRFFHFQEGVCSVCLERGGEKLPCCQGKMHEICLQDWIWRGPAATCPCCAQGPPCANITAAVVRRFQRVGEMRANLIALSNLINHTFIKTCKFDEYYLFSLLLQNLERSRQKRLFSTS